MAIVKNDKDTVIKHFINTVKSIAECESIFDKKKSQIESGLPHIPRSRWNRYRDASFQFCYASEHHTMLFSTTETQNQ